VFSPGFFRFKKGPAERTRATSQKPERVAGKEEDMKVLEKVVCMMLDVHLWTGRKKLDIGDLKLVGRDQIPPEDLASLGSKKIVSPEDIAIFATLKKRAERLLEGVGIRFLGGYALPETEVKKVSAELAGIQSEFTTAKKNFLAIYDQVVQDWINAHPDWGSIIRAAIAPKEEVERQLRFDFQMFKINPVDDRSVSQINAGLVKQVGGLGDRLFFEIGKQAEEAWELSFKGKVKITQKALRPVRAMREKLFGLSFLDPRVNPVIDRIDAILAKLPTSGPIENTDLDALAGLVLLLSNPDKMREHGAAARAAISSPTAIHAESQAEEEATETEEEFDIPSPAPTPTPLFTGTWF